MFTWALNWALSGLESVFTALSSLALFVSGVWLGQLVSSPNQADKWLLGLFSPFAGLPCWQQSYPILEGGSYPNRGLAANLVLNQIAKESFKDTACTL